MERNTGPPATDGPKTQADEPARPNEGSRRFPANDGLAPASDALFERLERLGGTLEELASLLRRHVGALPPAGAAACRVALTALLRLDPSARDGAAAQPALSALVRPFVAHGLVTVSSLRPLLAALESRDAAEALTDRAGKTTGRNRLGGADDEDDEGAPWYVEDAGLCLLWPFLTPLFERLGLVNGPEPAFIDEVARHRAALLVHLSASGDAEPPDHHLLLDKLLCGIAPDDVHGLDGPVTETEAAGVLEVLEAVVTHAPCLDALSPDDLREAFLMRPGAVSMRDGCWLLRVETRPHDVLLDRLPWPVRAVRLPWMELPLVVEW